MRTIIDVRTTDDHFPGIGRYTFQLVNALARQKDRDELVLLANAGKPNARFNLASLASEPNVKIMRTTARPFTLSEQWLLPRELRKLNPRVIHFPYIVMPYLAPRPLVLTIHDVIPVRLPHLFPLHKRVLYRISLLLALRAAAVVICISEATLSDLKAEFRLDRSRILVIHEGVGGSFHPHPKRELDRVQAAYALPSGYILYLGTTKPHKNLPRLIDALARLHPCPPLVIAGDEDSRYKETRRLVERMGMGNRVRFTGAVKEDDLPALYSGARAFVFPSLYEGFGLPVLEAMACGVPVACSGIPSLRETAGDAALFFDPQDQDSIAAALERLLTDELLCSDLQTRGLRRSAELSWDVAAQKTLEAYRLASP
jgi:glycosyltransferase involved in cell wall biosynthesis